MPPSTQRRADRRKSKRPIQRPAFTLVEMIVVVSIILIIITLALPAAVTLWAERKKADSFNTVQGMIRTSRALALQGDGKERGFFAYVDEDGVQQLVSIEQAKVPFVSDEIGQAKMRIAYQNIFEVTEDRQVAMPAPLRAVPRKVIDIPPGSTNTPEYYSDDELANDSFDNPFGPVNKAQQHRNYFTMIFSVDGEVVVGRDVLIMDISEDEDPQGAKHGDITSLRVGNGDPDYLADSSRASVTQYWQSGSSTETQVDIHPDGLALPFLVIDPENPDTALDFHSVDSVLLYDDQAFKDIGDATGKRDWLLEVAQPMYVNRWTGSVIRGPVGETQTQ